MQIALWLKRSSAQEKVSELSKAVSFAFIALHLQVASSSTTL